MSDLSEVNKPALHYCLCSMPRMKELAAPLQVYLGICSFSYMRIYKDCSYMSLLNGYEEFKKTYFETIEQSDSHFVHTMQNTLLNEPNFTIWPTERKNLSPVFSLLDAHNIWHGFQVSFRRDNYCELFSFTFDKLSGDKTDFFLKNIPLFIKFIDYFKTQAADLIDDSDKRKIAIFPKKFDIGLGENEVDTNGFLNSINRPFLIKAHDGHFTKLTKRETECLKIFANNKTAKEIANILNLSHRTVELHLEHIKQKLGISFKNQLFDLYKSSFF
ncbi:MAG: helix-turn-helix domain-containing protein [Pseudomonadota bacterium]